MESFDAERRLFAIFEKRRLEDPIDQTDIMYHQIWLNRGKPKDTISRIAYIEEKTGKIWDMKNRKWKALTE